MSSKLIKPTKTLQLGVEQNSCIKKFLDDNKMAYFKDVIELDDICKI
jgi:hypothetical protein